jgi:hypothetical protein
MINLRCTLCVTLQRKLESTGPCQKEARKRVKLCRNDFTGGPSRVLARSVYSVRGLLQAVAKASELTRVLVTSPCKIWCAHWGSLAVARVCRRLCVALILAPLVRDLRTHQGVMVPHSGMGLRICLQLVTLCASISASPPTRVFAPQIRGLDMARIHAWKHAGVRPMMKLRGGREHANVPQEGPRVKQKQDKKGSTADTVSRGPLLQSEAKGKQKRPSNSADAMGADAQTKKRPRKRDATRDALPDDPLLLASKLGEADDTTNPHGAVVQGNPTAAGESTSEDKIGRISMPTHERKAGMQVPPPARAPSKGGKGTRGSGGRSRGAGQDKTKAKRSGVVERQVLARYRQALVEQGAFWREEGGTSVPVPTRNVYLGKLPYNVTEDEIWRFVSATPVAPGQVSRGGGSREEQGQVSEEEQGRVSREPSRGAETGVSGGSQCPAPGAVRIARNSSGWGKGYLAPKPET